MAKLAAFYSRADENYFSGGCRYVTVGNTEKLAKMISELTGADLFKIEQKIPYAADYNTCIQQAKEDLQAKARPELVSAPDSLDGYDEIYLGYPNMEQGFESVLCAQRLKIVENKNCIHKQKENCVWCCNSWLAGAEFWKAAFYVAL